MVKIVKFSCHGCHAPTYGCSLPGDNSGSYVLHSDYAALERRLAELVEAVRWERECGTVSFTDLWFDEWNRTEDQSRSAMRELRFTLRAARAAVDALVVGV